MDVIGHEAEAVDLDFGLGAEETEAVEVFEAVGVCDENAFLVVSSLGDVVDESGDNEAGDSGHQPRSGRGVILLSRKVGSVPSVFPVYCRR